MRNWEQEQIVKKPMLACYIDPETKTKIKALARARGMSISELARELIELALPHLEANLARDGQALGHEPEAGAVGLPAHEVECTIASAYSQHDHSTSP